MLLITFHRVTHHKGVNLTDVKVNSAQRFAQVFPTWKGNLKPTWQIRWVPCRLSSCQPTFQLWVKESNWHACKALYRVAAFLSGLSWHCRGSQAVSLWVLISLVPASSAVRPRSRNQMESKASAVFSTSQHQLERDINLGLSVHLSVPSLERGRKILIAHTFLCFIILPVPLINLTQIILTWILQPWITWPSFECRIDGIGILSPLFWFVLWILYRPMAKLGHGFHFFHVCSPLRGGGGACREQL